MFANIRQIEWDGVNTIKFWKARIRFLSNVLVAVAVVVAL